MKPNAKLVGCLLALAVQAGFAIPVISGDGLEPVAGTGSFGATGRILEYRVQVTPGLSFTASQSLGVDGLRLNYAFTAASAMGFSSAAVYLDADINQEENTWFNERGEALMASGGATSYEVDEPGFGFSYAGDIFTNYGNGAFDNTVFGGQSTLVDDVALGLGFGFGNLGAGDQLLLEILISESAFGTDWGTFLHQWDETDGIGGDHLYFAGRYTIRRMPPVDPPETGTPAVPEPGTRGLLALGLAVLVMRRRFLR